MTQAPYVNGVIPEESKTARALILTPVWVIPFRLSKRDRYRSHRFTGRVPGWGPGRMKETQFRKGCRTGIAAQNWRPIGTVLPDSDGYLRIKVREAVHGKEPTGFGNARVWPFLSRHIWEHHHGPIPAAHVVVLKDKNRANCAIENLELISRAELARRNRMWTKFPRELAEVIQLNGALKRKIGGARG